MNPEHQLEVGLVGCFFAVGLVVESADCPQRWKRWGGLLVGGLAYVLAVGLVIIPPILSAIS